MKYAPLALLTLANLTAQTQSSAPVRVPAGTEPAVYGPTRTSADAVVVVRLSDPPLAMFVGPNAKRAGFRVTAAQQRAYVQNLNQKQNTVSGQISALGGREVGRVNRIYNAVIVSIASSQLNRLKTIPGVAGVRPLGDYQKALNTTLPYIRAAALHIAGLTGRGVKVAVLDTGVDYTHKNLGGPGTPAAYTAAYGATPDSTANKTRDGLFPTAKVYEGFDFVGEKWPAAPLQFDPDPIDFEGHGTHVADIIAGASDDGTHKGVAPGAKILAVKTCSTVTTSCSGLALLLGLDFALDPNLDGDISDAVDIINLSLGNDYGQREDDISEALRIAGVLGVVTVAAAGNAGDRPYIIGSPATAPSVIAVAQTEVPTALTFPLIIHSPPAIAGTYPNTETLPFAPIATGFSFRNIVYVGRGCPEGSIAEGSPADAYLGNPAGKVALIDRGACNVSLKIDRAAKAGAVGVLIGLVAPGDAVGFSFGGGDTFVPSLVITQAVANVIKAQLAMAVPVIGSVTPGAAIQLSGSMVTSSSRGPGHSYNSIKPDIAAPGASISAEVGTGTGETAFSGTSGATPMISGSAALLLEACPICSPVEIKARLMNTAEISVETGPRTAPGELAPISRMGAGEVRVDRALNVRTLAWDAGDPSSVSLGFGTLRLNTPTALTKKVLVRNFHSAPRTYSITPEFRYASDAAGAVTISAPPAITVPANGSATFLVTLSVNNPGALPAWTLNGGTRGGDGFRLQGLEFDGFIRISDAIDTIRTPWHFLPHKASGLLASTSAIALGGSPKPLSVTNTGVADGSVTIFSLLGTSARYPADFLPRPGDFFALVDLRAAGVNFIPNGAGPGADVIQFGFTTWGERSHPNYPALFAVFIDVNGDNVEDYVAFNGEAGGFGVSGQNVTTLLNLRTNEAITRLFTTADLNSANATLNILRNDLLVGGSSLSPAAQIRLEFCAADNYYTGVLTDCIGPAHYTLNTPRFAVAPGSSFVVPAGGTQLLTVIPRTAGNVASPSQSGLLLFYGDAKPGKEAEIVTITP
jgi:subtilisin family serine protease